MMLACDCGRSYKTYVLWLDCPCYYEGIENLETDSAYEDWQDMKSNLFPDWGEDSGIEELFAILATDWQIDDTD
jgi:hypothetical protein